MQELDADKGFFDWLRRVSSEYGEAMAVWSQAVHDAVAGNGGVSPPERLMAATDAAVERLVQALMAIGEQHDAPDSPRGRHAVLDALDRLLGTSAELLREARAGVQRHGISAISALAPHIGELRELEAEVERRTEQMRSRLENSFGDPGPP